ncbi:single-stranded DNA binding protein [Haloquadratum walsbyi]|uniref:Replication protein A n=1 Tax=Haloquadratum walsbyi (strain DSM 16854 / JCM 12705 / C23) TaxID=768065 RepID=G0LK35_HALWC|nr:single-stranded DNA binding protein [Haloquadratum walsbyi]CCC39461.1 replication protein A [Haloquadratum walsbyi C23]
MSSLTDIYDELDTDVSREEFESAVEDKVEQMGGLADEETAAKLIAHELRNEEVEGVADIEPGMDEAKFLAKVLQIGDCRTFERDGDAEDGRVINIEVADASGQIRVTMWDDMADDAINQLEVGQVLRIGGRPKDGYDGVEIDVDTVEPAPDAEIDVDIHTVNTHRVEDLSLGLSDVNLRGRVLSTDKIRTFDRDDGSEGRVANLSVGDPTGRIRVTLWDGSASLVDSVDPDDSIEIVDGYVREQDGALELHVGDRGTIESIDEDVEYVPDTDPIETVVIDETADIAGGVIETDTKRTFDRDDGSKGQVRNVRIRDDTGDIRVALWGDKADLDIDLADYVVCTDVEIQEGWQDDHEASAGWRSAVYRLDERPEDATTTVESSSNQQQTETGKASGLDAFAETNSDETTVTASPTSQDSNITSSDSMRDNADHNHEQAASDGGASTIESPQTSEDDNTTDSDVESFTGTVVQAGSPVVLDNGTDTRRVETDASLRLGEVVTVSGSTDGQTITPTEIDRSS